MHDYLKSEIEFVRSLVTKCLILIVMIVVTRLGLSQSATGNSEKEAISFAIAGFGLGVSQGLVCVVGPFFCLFMAVLNRYEVSVLTEMAIEARSESTRHRRLPSDVKIVSTMLILPAIAALILTYHLTFFVVPSRSDCNAFSISKFMNFSQFGTPTKYCISDVTAGMPWTYQPVQSILYFFLTGFIFYLCTASVRAWASRRGKIGSADIR